MSSVGNWKTNLARNGRLIYRLVGSIPTQSHITYIYCYKIVLMFYNYIIYTIEKKVLIINYLTNEKNQLLRNL